MPTTIVKREDLPRFHIRRWDGFRIKEAGFYSGIPLEKYHHANICVGPSVSSSVLRKIVTKSPAHAFATSPYNPERIDESDKEAFILGRAAHHLFLGEDDFSTLYIARPDMAPDGRAWNGNNKSCIEWLNEQAAAGRTVLKPNQIEQIRGMARSLAAEPLVKNGMLNGIVEVSGFWIDEKTGLWVKIRPDAIPTASLDFVDLKTSADSGSALDAAIFRWYRYDMQGAMVAEGFQKITNEAIDSFSLVFIEKDKPHAAEFIAIDKPQLAEASADVRVALDVFAFCFKHNYWFGPSGTQNDARYANKGQRDEDYNTYRRDMLKREITGG